MTRSPGFTVLDFILFVPVAVGLYVGSVFVLHFIADKSAATLADDLRPIYRSR